MKFKVEKLPQVKNEIESLEQSQNDPLIRIADKDRVFLS